MVAAALAAALALLPGFSPLAQGPAGGQVLTGTFPGELRPGLVYLPPHFSAARRYPVVYLLHGMPGSPTEYLGGADLPGFADSAIEQGHVRPFVAIVPAAGADARYNGEWAGPWAESLVRRVVPWVDAHLPTIASPGGRVLAGLSAGGFGAADIGLHNPGVFGTVEAWSGYFAPLHDGPFRGASAAVLRANDPRRLVTLRAAALQVSGIRVFVSTGPAHSHWFTPRETTSFARELAAARIPVELREFSVERGVWRRQLDAGLTWAFGS